MDISTADSHEICPPHAVITSDILCLGCDYNLRTLQFCSKCPECGRDVAQSLRILHKPRETSLAIRLVALAFLLSLGGMFISPLTTLSLILLVVSAHMLQYRCELSNISNNGSIVRWFLILTVILMATHIFSIANTLTHGEYRLLASIFNSSSINSVSMTTSTSGKQVIGILYSDVAGSIEVTSDIQNHIRITLLDDTGKVFSTSTLAKGQSALVNDCEGQQVKLYHDTFGRATIKPRAPSEIQVSLNGGVSLNAGESGVNLIIIAAQVVIGLIAIILYILICRSLAILFKPRSTKWYKILLWFCVTYATIVISVSTIAILYPSTIYGNAIAFFLFLPVIPLSLAAYVILIVSALCFSTKLRQLPRHYSECTMVPVVE